MSRTLQVVLMDLEGFRSLQGGTNARFRARVLRGHAQRIKRMDRYFAQTAGYVPVEKVIDQILAGHVTPKKAFPCLFEYEHAAAMLADTFGTALDAGRFAECGGGRLPTYWMNVEATFYIRLQEAKGDAKAFPFFTIGKKLLQKGTYLKIPLKSSALTGTGYLTHEECVALFELVSPLRLAGEVMGVAGPIAGIEEVHEGCKQYRGWLQRAAKKGLGLYFHALT